MKLGYLCEIKTNFPEADFWLIRKGSKKEVGKPTKEYSPAQLFMLSDEKINAELEKCILVCSNCHKLIHHEDNYKAHDKRKKYGSN